MPSLEYIVCQMLAGTQKQVSGCTLDRLPRLLLTGLFIFTLRATSRSSTFNATESSLMKSTSQRHLIMKTGVVRKAPFLANVRHLK